MKEVAKEDQADALYGEKFSQKKQDQVLNFKKLIMVKGMKTFLRVVGQLREHLEIISVI